MAGVAVDLVEDMKVYIDLFNCDACIFIATQIMLWFSGVPQLNTLSQAVAYLAVYSRWTIPNPKYIIAWCKSISNNDVDAWAESINFKVASWGRRQIQNIVKTNIFNILRNDCKYKCKQIYQ